ncbi:MAG: hypothetical protein QOJ29_2741 [Thermoleophilaceae bacterium]|nr:hypothetical protein [Thermoleophilaceae bacterium]
MAARARTHLTRDRSGPAAILSGVSKRARRRHQTRPPTPLAGPPQDHADPERLLLQQIADGALDPHLPALAQAIDARLQLLHTVRSVTALARLNIGDRVRINHHARPRYLHGVQGTILELDERTATICIHRPVGRFTTGEIRCPPLALDRLNPVTHSHREGADPA